ncbi:MAG TPA: hypothetical protein VFO94_04665, partial [Gammaproteobacteria bacterium]|nr:hypothetical protein [Gammaproteobacteria bacterium]
MTDRDERLTPVGMDRREFGRRVGALGLSTLGAVVLKSALASDAREAPRTRAGYPQSTSVLAIADRTFVSSIEFAAEVERHG